MKMKEPQSIMRAAEQQGDGESRDARKSNDALRLIKELIMEFVQETDNPETLRFVYVYLLARKQKVKEEVG